MPSTACSRASWSRRPTAPISRRTWRSSPRPDPARRAARGPRAAARACRRPEAPSRPRAQEARLVAAYLRPRGRARAPVPLRRRRAPVPRDDERGRAYEDALRAAGIPFRTVGGRHYYDRSEVGWTIAALAAIEDPHDPVALVGALRSPFFGVTDEMLLGLHTAGRRVLLSPAAPGGRRSGACAGMDAPRCAPSGAERRGAGRGRRAAPGRHRGRSPPTPSSPRARRASPTS